MVTHLWHDVLFALRLLRKSPVFTLTAVLTLALGVGANTAVFSVVNAFMFRPLPVPNGERLAVLASQHQSNPDPHGVSYLDLQDYRRSLKSFTDLAGYAPGLVGLHAEGRAERILVSFVTGNYFSMLGLQPELGRLIRADEGLAPRTDPVIVLSHAFWQRHFNGDHRVIGRAVTINGQPCTIVGVTPPAFTGTYAIVDTEAYLPLSMSALDRGTDVFDKRDNHSLHVLGPLQPNVTPKQAAVEAAVVARQLAQQYPDTNKDVTVQVFPETRARPEEDAATGMPLASAVFLLLVGLVLLVAAVNVTNIVLARATARQRETAIRAALGAGRGRLARQLLTESLVLSVIGGAAGIAVGVLASRLLAGIRLPGDIPIRFDFHLDGRVLAYSLAATALTGVLVGLVPALRAWRSDLNAVLREGGRGAGTTKHRIRSALVVAQIAVSLVLLVAAGLFVRSMAHAEQLDLGFRTDGILNAHMDVSQLGYNETRGRAFYRELGRRVASVPGVEAFSFAYSAPMGYYNASDYIDVEGHPAEKERRAQAGWNAVDPAYFPTLGVALMRGRLFTDADDERGRPVAIVNQRMATMVWSGQDPIGQHFSFKGPKGPWIEVVGVARDGKYGNLFEDPRPYFYVPLAQRYMPLRVLHVRTTLAPDTLAPAIEREAHAIEPDLPLFDVQSMRHALGGGNGLFLVRMGAVFASALGLLGLTLAMIGIYGVVSYVASQRTREIGVRMALGATPSDILGLLLRNGLVLVGIGLGGGLVAALGLSRLMASFLMGISPSDPLTFASVAPLLGIVALLACLLPAWRATRVDPTTALRAD